MESGETTNRKRKRKNPTVHSCALCPYSTKQSYNNHLNVHSSKRPFKCPECPYKTKSQRCVDDHVKNIHLFKSHSSRPFPCPESGCPFAAKQKSNLTSHLRIHSGEKPFVCLQPSCNYSSSRKDHFVEHTRVHTGETPYVCQFDSCSYATKTQGLILRHSRTHTKEKPLKCSESNCDFSTARYFCLKQHQLTHDPKEGEERPSFKCPLCEYKGKSKDRLSGHTKTHTLEKYFKCDEPNCNFEAKTTSNLKKHKVVHSNENPFACSFESCEFRSNYKIVLDNHLKTHSNERRYKCELCPYRARTRSVVSNHIKHVHSDAQLFNCTEPQCESKFKTKKALDNHILFHKGEKNYSCSFPGCGFKTVSEEFVKSHQKRIHESEKIFQCKFCTFVTKFQGNLISHVRNHTKEEPFICKEVGCEFRAKQGGQLKEHQKRSHARLTT